MVNKKMFWLGILVNILVFGMTVIGCDDGSKNDIKTDSNLNGTWIGTQETGESIFELKFNNGNFELFVDDTIFGKGTYTTNGNTITSTLSHLHGDFYGLESKWYKKEELVVLGYFLMEALDIVFSPRTYHYSVRSNILALTYESETKTLTKK